MFSSAFLLNFNRILTKIPLEKDIIQSSIIIGLCSSIIVHVHPYNQMTWPWKSPVKMTTGESVLLLLVLRVSPLQLSSSDGFT